MTLKEIEREALKLSEDERAELAEVLTESIQRNFDPAIEAAWESEVARRVERLRRGEEKLFDGDEVIREAEAILNEEV